MKILVMVVLFAHAFAHIVGFIVPWKLATMPDAPYKTTILNGRVDLGDTGIRLIGVLWLLTGLAFGASAVLLFVGTTWWMPFTGTVALTSLLLSLVSLPEAKIGVPVNLIILGVLAARFLGWF